jgi:hypothetical protein
MKQGARMRVGLKRRKKKISVSEKRTDMLKSRATAILIPFSQYPANSPYPEPQKYSLHSSTQFH